MGTMSVEPKMEAVHSLSRGVVGVDRDNKRLLGYVVAERGPFKSAGRGEFDTEGLRQIVAMANGGRMGLKSRFTHPGLSSDALGTHLGRSVNFRMDGDDKVRADLIFADAAFNGPKGNLAGYVMDMAEQDHEAIGSSLVIDPNKVIRKGADGSTLKDESGKELPPLWFPKKLYASDIVDEGDATKSLLSTAVDIEQLEDAHIRQVFEILNTTFAGQDRATVESRVTAFLGRYLSHRFGPVPADLNINLTGDTKAFEKAVEKSQAEFMKMKLRIHEIAMKMSPEIPTRI